MQPTGIRDAGLCRPKTRSNPVFYLVDMLKGSSIVGPQGFEPWTDGLESSRSATDGSRPRSNGLNGHRFCPRTSRREPEARVLPRSK